MQFTDKRLTVDVAEKGDIYKDIARLTRKDRGGIPEGRICCFEINGVRKMLIVRGLIPEYAGSILLDEVTREAFNVKPQKQYEVKFRQAGIWGQLHWACTVADPAARIAAVIAVVSLILGIIGIILSIIPMIPPLSRALA